MARASVEDPIKVFRYQIEIDGFIRAGFSEVTGLVKETDVVEYREGGQNETPQKSAGLTKFPDLTFKRGQIFGSLRGGDNDFYDWAQQVHDVAAGGNAANYRRDIEVVQYSSSNLEIRRWRLSQCWPRSFKASSDLAGLTSDNSIEEIIVTYEGFELVGGGSGQGFTL